MIIFSQEGLITTLIAGIVSVIAGIVYLIWFKEKKALTGWTEDFKEKK